LGLCLVIQWATILKHLQAFQRLKQPNLALKTIYLTFKRKK